MFFYKKISNQKTIKSQLRAKTYLAVRKKSFHEPSPIYIVVLGAFEFMGSDSVKKSYRLAGGPLHLCNELVISLTLFVMTVVLIVTFIRQDILYPTKSSLRRSIEIVQRVISREDLNRARSNLPRQCFSLLEQMNHCQNSKEKIVFACHRKWCGMWYGHCEVVNGIGDRTQRMLSMASDAIEKCLRIELDYPQSMNGIEMRFPQTLEYRDKWGLIAEIFRFRSYDVSNREGGDDIGFWGKTTQYLHFTPNDYDWHKADPCLYHILFKKSESFQAELDYYSKLFNLETEGVIGIHFRTGDTTAFGVDNHDIRAQGSTLQESYEKMVTCAMNQAALLHINPDINGRYHFFLATDNQNVKEMARRDERFVIYMTMDVPSPYVKASGDRTAYHDLYLLSMTQGITVNVLPDIFHNPLAERVSTFSKLAWNIAFMNDEQFYECEIV